MEVTKSVQDGIVGSTDRLSLNLTLTLWSLGFACEDIIKNIIIRNGLAIAIHHRLEATHRERERERERESR